MLATLRHQPWPRIISEARHTCYFAAGPTITFALFIHGAAKVGLPAKVWVVGTLIFAVGQVLALANGLLNRRHLAPRAATVGNLLAELQRRCSPSGHVNQSRRWCALAKLPHRNADQPLTEPRLAGGDVQVRHGVAPGESCRRAEG
jgi:hypothetical protein